MTNQQKIKNRFQNVYISRGEGGGSKSIKNSKSGIIFLDPSLSPKVTAILSMGVGQEVDLQSGGLQCVEGLLPGLKRATRVV